MELDPHEEVDGVLLFAPQLYDPNELAVVRERLRPDDVFLDIGAHIGLYSLVASKEMGPGGRVVAFEADLQTYRTLCRNIQLNGDANITPVNVGVSDREETLRLVLNVTGNRGGNSFLATGGQSVDVSCRPLLTLLDELRIQRIDGVKLDIEGLEYRVLRAFFANAPDRLRPRFALVEHFGEWDHLAGGNVLRLLQENGYSVTRMSEYNWLAEIRLCVS